MGTSLYLTWYPAYPIEAVRSVGGVTNWELVAAAHNPSKAMILDIAIDRNGD